MARHTARASPSASRARAAVVVVVAVVAAPPPPPGASRWFFYVSTSCVSIPYSCARTRRTHTHAHGHTHTDTHTVLDVSTTRPRLPRTHDIPHPPSPHRFTPTQALHTPHYVSFSHISLVKPPVHAPMNRPVASPGPTAPTPWRRGDVPRASPPRDASRDERGVARDEGATNAASGAIAAIDGRTNARAFVVRHSSRSVERSPRPRLRVDSSAGVLRPCRARRRRRADEG